MDSLGRFIAIIVAILLVLLFPLQYIAQGQRESMDGIVTTYTTEFTNVARSQGYISLEMYEQFVNKLDQTKELYDVSIEVAQPILGKDISLVNSNDNEIKKLNHTNIETKHKEPKYSLTRINTLNSDNFVEHIHTENCNHDDISYIDHEFEINSLSTHNHTDDCYAGHRHSGGQGVTTSTNRYGCYTTPIYTSSYCYSTYSLTHTGSSSTSYTCGNSSCGRPVTATTTLYYYQCGNGHSTMSNGWWSWSCSSCGWSGAYAGGPGNISGMSCSSSTNTITGYRCTLIEDLTPICNQVVTSIIPTNPIQTVIIGNPIITTAIANYLNGSTGVVSCSSNYNSQQLGKQSITLTYSGLVGNAKTTGTRTGNIEVTVKEPYKLTGITVTPTSQSIKRYTNPEFIVTASYDNNTSKVISDYQITNFFKNVLGNQNATITYTEDEITKTASVNITVTKLSQTCSSCGNEYLLDEHDVDHGCPVCNSKPTGLFTNSNYVEVMQGENLPIIVEAVYKNGSTMIINDWNSNLNQNEVGVQFVTITYQELFTYITVNVRAPYQRCLICGEEYSLLEDGSDPGCRTCFETVVYISASPKHITTNKHMPVELTVIATFRDGHTEVVTDWSIDFIPDREGTFSVTVFYRDMTDQITITVLEDGVIQCPYCDQTYSFQQYPGGCPSCSTEIIGISAELRNGGNKTPIGAPLHLTIIIEFRDTHKEFAYTGWSVSGFDHYKLGWQNVTVIYKNHSTLLSIEVVNTLTKTTCPNGHEYYLNEDGSDPGCSQCDISNSMDQAIFYFEITYTNIILETLYSEGIYYLQAGNYLTVTVSPRNKSMRARIGQMFFRTSLVGKREKFVFGGEVR